MKIILIIVLIGLIWASGENTSRTARAGKGDGYSTSNVSIYSRGSQGSSNKIQPYIECSIKCNQSKVYVSMKMSSFLSEIKTQGCGSEYGDCSCLKVYNVFPSVFRSSSYGKFNDAVCETHLKSRDGSVLSEDLEEF
jgi:hypothetical protein